MKIFILSLMILSTISLLHCLTVETASLTEFLYGSTEDTGYDNWMHHIVEGLASEGFNQYAPWDRQTNDFGNYVRADDEQLSKWSEIIYLFLAQDFTTLTALINAYDFPYEVVKFNDTDTGRTYYMLREFLNLDYFDDNGEPDKPELHQHGSFDFGWGLYIFNPESDIPIIVNTPHPKDDFITVPISSKAFQEWDARYFMIAGAGREALWTERRPYNNSKSLSDPTRVSKHPFNTAYRAFCDEIRDTFQRREFSVQVHSFDYTHMGYNSLQIALGTSSERYPSLPIRDLSNSGLDLINSSPYIIHQTNTIGEHSEIIVTDYYSVHYSTHDLYYYYEDEALPISNRINLPGVGGPQFDYSFTSDNWNKYDVFSPFFHIEMEELPSIYPQTMAYYKWFYSYDSRTQSWDTNNFFTKAIKYYTPWVDAMSNLLPTLFEFDNGEPPTDPTNLRITNDVDNRLTLEWDRSYDYNFYSYEVIYSDEPFNFEEPNYQTINRSNLHRLAAQAYSHITFLSLDPDSDYYFTVRAVDYNNNFSEFSNSIIRYALPARVSNIKALGRDGKIDISWTADSQNENNGFNIWRAISGSDDYQLIASWEDDESLVGKDTTNFVYSYIDFSAENYEIYDYRLSCIGFDNYEHFFHQTVSASPQPIFKLYFANYDFTIIDSLEFGVNPFTFDEFNTNFDIIKPSRPSDSYIYATSYYLAAPYLIRNLQRDIKEYFNPQHTYNTWTVRVRTDQMHQPIKVFASYNFPLNQEKLYLRSDSTSLMHKITEEEVTLEFDEDSYDYFTLYWGNVQPTINLANNKHQYLTADENMTIYWTIDDFSFMIEQLDIYLANESDSLFIAQFTDYQIPDSLDWQVPDDFFAREANLYLKATLIDGFQKTSKSNYLITIADNSFSYSIDDRTFLTNPFVDYNIDKNTAFGEEAILYHYDNEENLFIEVDSVIFGKGYYIMTDSPINYSTSGSFLKTEHTIALSKGWNLIPNVLIESIGIGDTNFLLDKTKYTYNEAIHFDIIENGIWTIQDGRYTLTTAFNPGNSYMIYSNLNNVEIIFTPFFKGSKPLQFKGNWEITLCLNSEEDWYDEVIIGASDLSSEDYNIHYDLPKPPKTPNSELYLYLESSCGSNPFPMMSKRYNQDIIGENQNRYWNFVIETSNTITFSKKSVNLPPEWTVQIIIDNETFILSSGETYDFHPLSEITHGQIRVTNESVTELDKDISLPHSLLNPNYPNPFIRGKSKTRNEGTNISFYINEPNNVKIEVFNIKGQLVSVLINEQMSAGKHTVSWSGQNSYGKDVAAGIYFYRMSVGEKIINHRKMLILN